jgi:hypothetical protein
VLGGAALLAFYLWTVSSSGDPFAIGREQSDYYNLLVDGLLEGRLSLLVQPAPELLALPNPYDPAQNGPYRLHDVSLYENRYYLYFGPAPAVVAWLPWRLLPLGDLPETLAVALFAFAGTCFAIALLRFLVRRYLPDTPRWMLAAGAVSLVTASAVPFTLRRVAIYEAAIMAGYAFCFAGLWCLATGMLGERLRPRRLAAGSLLLGLAVASRPTMLLPAALPMVAWLVLRRREGIVAPRRLAVLLLAPLAVCGVLLAAYNALRFGSPFEFGQRYQLAGVEVRAKDSYNFGYLLPGAWYYLLARPHLTLGFPFVHLVPPPQSYPGELPAGYDGIEVTGGLLITAPIVLLAAGAWWALRFQRELRAVAIALAGTGLAIMLLVSFTLWGATMRYEVDFASLLLIPGLLVWFALAGRGRRALRAAGAAAIGWGAAAGLAFGMTGYYDSLRTAKPGQYEFFQRATSPLPTGIAMVRDKVALTEIVPEPGADTDLGPGYGRWDLDVPPTGAELTMVSGGAKRVRLEFDLGGAGTLMVRGGRPAILPVGGRRERVELVLDRGINRVELSTSGQVVALRNVAMTRAG